MTTQAEAREAVYSRWNTLWVVGSDPRTPFTFENEDFDGDAQTETWARVVVRHAGGGQETLGRAGDRKFRRAAFVLVSIYGVANEGMGAVDDLVQEIRTIFEGVSFSGLDFGDALSREVGSDGKWYITEVECLFDYDEVR